MCAPGQGWHLARVHRVSRETVVPTSAQQATTARRVLSHLILPTRCYVSCSRSTAGHLWHAETQLAAAGGAPQERQCADGAHRSHRRPRPRRPRPRPAQASSWPACSRRTSDARRQSAVCKLTRRASRLKEECARPARAPASLYTRSLRSSGDVWGRARPRQLSATKHRLGRPRSTRLAVAPHAVVVQMSVLASVSAAI